MASTHNLNLLQSYASIIRGERVAPTVYDHFPSRTSINLGIAQMVCTSATIVSCLVCFGFYGILISLGLQFPIMATIAGSFGICAGAKKTSCKIVTNMVLSILCAVNSLGLAVLSASILGLYDYLKTLAMSSSTAYTSNALEAGLARMEGFCIVLLVLSLLESVVAITSSIIGCHFVCFCCKNCCCRFDVTTTDQVLLRASDDEERLLSASVAAPRNDGDVAMIQVAAATGTSPPYVGSNFVVSPTSYVAFPK